MNKMAHGERNSRRRIAEKIDDYLYYKYSDGYSDATTDICNPTNAQIDAQAKTMEELILRFKVNQSNEVSQKEYEFIMRCLKNYPNESLNTIDNFISGFLAAGGVIKE